MDFGQSVDLGSEIHQFKRIPKELRHLIIEQSVGTKTLGEKEIIWLIESGCTSTVFYSDNNNEMAKMKFCRKCPSDREKMSIPETWEIDIDRNLNSISYNKWMYSLKYKVDIIENLSGRMDSKIIKSCNEYMSESSVRKWRYWSWGWGCN
jgi:hypothetical protein